MSPHGHQAERGFEEHAAAFAATFVFLFALLFLFLVYVGATPDSEGDKVAKTATTTPTVAAVNTTAGAELPLRVVARDIGLDTTVANPASSEVSVLDQALLHGSVRYPTSAPLGVDGTMLLFGHSSYLPVVHNQAYKTFDGIQDLKVGSVVSVYSATVEYRYQVASVRVANAEEDSIELTPTGRHLTLLTCDSFASKNHRFVVRADLVATYPSGK